MALGFHDGTAQRIPDRGLSQNIVPRIKETPFGDGYTQRLEHGINNLQKSFSVTFKDRTKAEIYSIANFFEGNRGIDAFNFTIPTSISEETIKVVAKDWQVTYQHDNYWTIQANFERYYEP